MNEIVSITGVDQFDGGSAYKCGFVCVAEASSMSKVGQSPTKSPLDVSALAHQLYTAADGPDVPTNEWGMSLPQLYTNLHAVGLHYQGLPVDMSVIRAYIQAGYPVIVAGLETSFYDMELGDVVPYPWTPTGTHVILLTGVEGNNFLVRDSANIIAPNTLRPGPRVYDASKMQLISATAVVPSWMPQPGYPLQVKKGSVVSSTHIPDGWKDDGATLTAPNGKIVVKGFRARILSDANWQAVNIPLENEHGVSSEEMSNPSLGGGTQQIFRLSVLEWTQARGVYEMWVGQELLAVRAALHDALSKLSAVPVSKPVDPAQQAAMHTLLVGLLNATSPFAQLNQQAQELAKEF